MNIQIRGLLLLILLAQSATILANECETSNDPFKGTESVMVKSEITIFESPAQKFIGYEKNGDVRKYVVAAIYFLDGWKFLGEEAYDKDQTKFENVISSRNTASGGKVMEMVQIPVGKAYIQNHTQSDILIRIYGKKGNEDLAISADMVRAFIDCLEGSGMD